MKFRVLGGTVVLFLAMVQGTVLAAYKYRDYDDIVTAVNNLDTGGGTFATAFNVGTTANGTAIRGIVISKDATSTNNEGKPDVVLIGTIHGKEWIAAEVCMYIASYLVEKRTDTTTVDNRFKDMNIKKLLENAEIVIVPVMNPDGYKWSRNEQNPGGSPDDLDTAWDRTVPGWWDPGRDPKFKDWRKSRRDLSDTEESNDTLAGQEGDVGVDCNRTFSVLLESFGGRREQGPEKLPDLPRSLGGVGGRNVGADSPFQCERGRGIYKLSFVWRVRSLPMGLYY